VTKRFSIAVKGTEETGLVQKLGELPPFGPPTPPRVFKLIGEEYRELFLKGRRAENRGLGIGATLTIGASSSIKRERLSKKSARLPRN
jgi:hypothetical protein